MSAVCVNVVTPPGFQSCFKSIKIVDKGIDVLIATVIILLSTVKGRPRRTEWSVTAAALLLLLPLSLAMLGVAGGFS